MKRLPILMLLLLAVTQLTARDSYDINRNWKFFTYNERDSLVVNIPHTWNHDALSGRRDYYRGSGNYLKYINIRPEWRGKRLFVKFNGANSVTTLMVNGKFVGEHKGGNNAFVFEVTDHVDYNGTNLFWVVVNNSPRIDVLPTGGSENMYGGIYRNMELIVAGQATIGLDNFGSDGIMVRYDRITEDRAEGKVLVRVNSASSRNVELSVEITDAYGKVVSENTNRVKADKGISQHTVPFHINSPVLWHGTDNPHLYNVAVTLKDGNSAETVATATGVRSFSVDPKTGFSLNGRPYPLRGVIVHRDRASYGPVSHEWLLREDVDLICEMGANAVRVADGTHHPDFYRLCDERGIIVMADIPFVGATSLENKGFYDTPDFRENTKQQLQELVYQHYNNPSIAVWGLFSHPEMRGDNPVEFIRGLNAMAKAIDPGRLTAGFSNKDGEVNTITDLIVWSHSYGWREGRPEDMKIWQQQIHGDRTWSKVKSGVSYRCGGSAHQQSGHLRKTNINSSWHPENWMTYVHEVQLGILNDDYAFWGLFVGDMFEYGSVKNIFGEGRGVDDCGLVTFDRQIKKDAFYLYKANWNKSDIFVHIAGRRNNLRNDTKQTVKVYSNANDVELFLNGVSVGSRQGSKGIFLWEDVEFGTGDNIVTAESAAARTRDDVIIRISPNPSAPR